MVEYLFQGEEVEEVWESMKGSYWVITDYKNGMPFGYACLQNMPDSFNEWGTIDPNIIDEPFVWTVDKMNWELTGPSAINIEKHEE